MKHFRLLLIMVLCFSLLGCGTSSLTPLNEISDLSLFGTSPEEAGELLGIDFSVLTPETENSSIGGADVSLDIYRSNKPYLVCGYAADLEFYFVNTKTPKDNPLGLAAIVLYFDSGADIRKIADNLTTVYIPEAKLNYDKYPGTNEVRSFNYSSYFSPDEGKEIDAIKGENTVKAMHYLLEVRKTRNQDIMFSIVAFDEAIKNHIEDYRE